MRDFLDAVRNLARDARARSAVALAASWLPAWRAARVAPIEVLRVD